VGNVGLRRSGGLQWYGVHTKFGGNCLVGSEIDMAITYKYGCRHTHTAQSLYMNNSLLSKGIG
jgi:hypothetical protein